MNRFNKWQKPLLSFAVGQPTVQLLSVITGFLLLRWLSVEDYAQYSLAFAFQSVISQLADLGYSASIMALAGEKARDPAVLGRYLQAARHLRIRTMTIALMCSAIIFPLITYQQHWNPITKVILMSAIGAGAIAQGLMIYSTPLLAHRQLNKYFRPQILVGFGRLGVCFLAQITGLLSAISCAWIGTTALAVNGWILRSTAKPYYIDSKNADIAARKEMLIYLAPLIPGIIFTAAQGQITVAIITLFGSTRNIAEVAALGRLGQLFLVFGAVNSVLLAPYISSLPALKVPRRYAQIVTTTFILLTLFALTGFMFPNYLLWILGPKYDNLKDLVGWVVVTSCISHFSGVLWTLHSGQRWIYWWGTALYIGFVLITQILSAIWLDLSQTSGVITFGIFTALAVLLSHISVGIYGLGKISKLNNSNKY